jgi:hypothetical protein
MADKNTKVLSKLIIHAFEKNDFKKEVRSFTTPINPETFTRTSHIELDTTRGYGHRVQIREYKSTSPEELKIEFILDGQNHGEVTLKSTKPWSVRTDKNSMIVSSMEGRLHGHSSRSFARVQKLNLKCPSHMEISYSSNQME